jgi:hypothetical protein
MGRLWPLTAVIYRSDNGRAALNAVRHRIPMPNWRSRTTAQDDYDFSARKFKLRRMMMANEWVSEFFRDVDAFKIEKLEPWFADDVDLRFANNPTINDKQTALQALGGFYSTIAGLRHESQAVIGSGDEMVQSSIVTYTRTDGSLVSLPVATYLRRNAAGKLTRLWIYIDIAPLYAEDAA